MYLEAFLFYELWTFFTLWNWTLQGSIFPSASSSEKYILTKIYSDDSPGIPSHQKIWEITPPSFEGILFILYNLKMSLHIMNLKLQPYQLFRIVLTPHLIIWINNFLPWINVATNCGCTSFFFWLKHSTKTIMYQLCLCLHFQSSNYTAFSRSSVSEV